jgi:hypothetical protein
MPLQGAGRVDLRTIMPLSRPPRIAVGVPGMSSLNWLTVLMRRSMTWAAMWNSVFFPIDAWAPGSIWDAILDRFDADEMLLGTNDTSLESKLARRYDPMLSFSFAHLIHRRAPLEGLTTNLRTIAAAQAAEVGQRASRIVRLFDVKSGPDSLRIMIAAAAGDIDDYTVKEITGVGAAYGKLELDPAGKPEDLQTAVSVALDPPNDSLWALNGWGTMSITDAFTYTAAASEGAIVVCGGTTEDVCLWLSLRTLRQRRNVFWLPDDLATDVQGPPVQYQAALFVKLVELQSSNADPPYFTSASLDEAAIKSRLGKLEKYGMANYQVGFDPLTRVRLHTFISLTRHEHTYRDQFTEGKSHSELRIGVPSWVSSLNDLGLRFLVEAHVVQYTLPTNPAARPLVSNPQSHDHRSGRYGVVADALAMFASAGDRIEHVLRRYQLELPSPDELMRRLAVSAGGNAWPSQNGQLAREVVSRLSGVKEAARQLNGAELQRVVADLMSGRKSPGKWELSTGRYVADQEYLARILGIDLEDEAGARRLRQLVHDWSTRGLILWGLALKCPVCGFSDYYALHEQTRSGVSCRRCQRDFLATATSAVRWRLVAAVDEVLRAVFLFGGVEEIALRAWIDGDADGANTTLGTQWALPGLELETDVAGTVAGDLTIGEAKSTGSFSDLDQIDRLARLAISLEARRLIFATSSSSWATPTLKRIAQAVAAAPGVRVEAYAGLLSPGGPVPSRN